MTEVPQPQYAFGVRSRRIEIQKSDHSLQMRLRPTALATMIALSGSAAIGASDEGLHDISGTYAEQGTTVRATVGAPQGEVSLCALLAVALDIGSQSMMARDAVVTVSQQDDLLLEFTMRQANGGGCRGTFTKADGLKVSDSAVILPRSRARASRGWNAVYRFRLDSETGLWVHAEFTKRDGNGGKESADYFFPRVVGSSGQAGNSVEE